MNLAGDPSINGIVVNCRDVTERVAAERLLLTTGRQQASVAQLGREALAASDIAGIVTSTASLVQSTLQAESCEIVMLRDGSEDLAVRATEDGIELLGDRDRPGSLVLDAIRAADEPLQFVDRLPGRPLLELTRLEQVPVDDTGIVEAPTTPAPSGGPAASAAPELGVGDPRLGPGADGRGHPGPFRQAPMLHHQRSVLRRHHGPNARARDRPTRGRGIGEPPGVARQPHHPAQPGPLRRPPHDGARAHGARRPRRRGPVPRHRPLQGDQRQPWPQRRRPHPRRGRRASARAAPSRRHRRPLSEATSSRSCSTGSTKETTRSLSASGSGRQSVRRSASEGPNSSRP